MFCAASKVAIATLIIGVLLGKIVLYIVSDHNSILGTSITILKPCHAFLQSSSIILLYKNLQGWEILTEQPGVSSSLQTTLIEQL